MVHSAGIVKLNQTITEARKSAVDSAGHVLAFAETARQEGPFQKLEFVSTIGVAGRTQGLVAETFPFRATDFHNTYEQAKSEAETLVSAKIEAGLPVTVHRPSMVIGDSQTGKIIHFQVFYYLAEFFSGRKTYGIVPDTGDVLLDIIPSDYVAQAIRATSALPETAGRVFHLCAGPRHAPRIGELTEQLRAIYNHHRLPLPHLTKLPFGLYQTLVPLAANIAPVKMRPMLRSLPFFLDYLADHQVFDNDQTNAFLSAQGICIPQAADYLDHIMGHYLQSKALSKSKQKPR
jgi:nucleoside-diphosphate-sugar epimerase